MSAAHLRASTNDTSDDEAIRRRRALITGGTSGIGRAIAAALAAQGCDVLATGRTEDEVAQFVSDGGLENEIAAARERLDAIQTFALDARTGTLRAVTLDVTDDDQVDRLAEGLDGLDVLVNCAGVIRRAGYEHDPAEFARVIDVNLTGTMRMCSACRPFLVGRRGCVLNVASMLSIFGSGVAPGYSASKGGVAQLTKSLAIAWANEQVRVNAIAPGWIETPLTAPLVADPARRQAIIDRTPLGRWGQPNDVVGAALFLCSPAARFITGVVLPIDGGYSIA